MLKSIFYILAICSMAGFSGVMITIGVSFGGYWRSLPPAEFLAWYGKNVQFVSNAIPLIVVPAFIGLIGAVWVSWSVASVRNLWLVSFLLFIVVAVMTFAYFVPANTAFANSEIAVADVTAKLNQWVMVHYVRIGLAMLSAIVGCIAMARHSAL
ncbi:MAG: DUF1772 domain-containing protein [Chloroflexota bacterium]